jgi:glycosyltransferase involved in cell wall biosynthesis
MSLDFLLLTFLLSSTLLSFLALLLTIFNALTIWRPRSKSENIEESVSILIPMRNEARNVIQLLANLSQVKDIERYELIAINDGSTDNTRALLSESKELLPQLQILEGKTLPPGWLGKPHALHQLFNQSKSHYLLFLDADVRISPVAIEKSISMMKTYDWNFISPYPKQIAQSFLERMIQPLLQWSWFASVPLRLATKYRITAMAVANGQFFLVERTALEKIAGFESIKDQVLDDIELARQLWRSGAKGSVVEGSALAECRMYQNGSELISGYSKSLWRAFGSPLGAAMAASLLLLTSWGALIAALFISPLGWLAFFAISASRLIAARSTRSFWQGFLLHPLSVIILLYILLRSFYLKRKGRLIWRDRVLST